MAQRPSNFHPEPSDIPPEDIEQALEAALEAGDDARAREVLDAAPRWMKRQPEFMLMRATVLLTLGDDQEGLRLLREIERKNPRLTALYLPLAFSYMDREWHAHGLQAAKRALSDRTLADENRAALEQAIEEATAAIQHQAAAFGLPFETMRRACIFNEQAQIAMEENKLAEADHFSKEAIKVIPNWPPPHNNRAQALYFSGRTAEAIATSQAVLTYDAENIFAMRSLVIYHLGLNQPEQAREHADRLEKLSAKFPADSMEIEHAIAALALIEDTPALWKMARRYLDAPPDSLFGRSWQCLAVAAVRSGKWKVALKLIEKADEEQLSPAGEKFRDELETHAGRQSPRLAWMPPAYPGADLFFHPKVMTEWEALLRNVGSSLSPSQQRKLENFFQKYPFMLAGMKRLLWEEDSFPIALQIFRQINIPEADAEMLRFASSQAGSQSARLQAILALIQAGRYTGSKIVEVWDEDEGEWHTTELNTQQIGPIEAKARPQTLALIEKAHKTKDSQEAVSLLQKAVEMEPTCALAIFNLGVALVQSGKVEEGEGLIYRSVEVDPTYTYGHASIALSEIEKGRGEEALEHLEIVAQAGIIAPETAVLANLAWAALAIEKRDLKSARQHFEMAAQIDPEHRLLGHYDETLQKAEDFDQQFGFLLEYQRQSTQRAHQKLLKNPLTAEMGLRACLETNTKDMLVATAHFLRTSSSGKKGELASWLAKVLLDTEFLAQTLDEDLQEKERAALRWLLEANGVRPWKEFVRRYGDDRDESTLWRYHEPESIPGRLRMSGLLYSGMLEGQQVAFIPADVRPLLGKLLE